MKFIIVNFVISGMLLFMAVPAQSQQTGQQQEQMQPMLNLLLLIFSVLN